MKAVILNYRQGKRTQSTNQLIVKPEKSSNKEDASKLMGRRVEWITPSGKKIVGKVTRVHGRKGTVIAKFSKGLPGQALSTEAEII